jgi:hypothetical protein
VISLASLKAELGFGLDETQYDYDLLRYLGQVMDLVRDETHRDIAWRIDRIETKATGTVDLRSAGHGLQGGESILVAGSNSTPSVDGEYVVTVVDEDMLRITAAAVTKVGTDAALHIHRTKLFRIDGGNHVWVPQVATPFYAITELKVWYRGEWVLVDPDDYDLCGDTYRKSVSLVFTGSGTATDDGAGNTYFDGSYWPIETTYPRGQYGLRQRSSMDTMRMSYWAGLRVVPARVKQAIESLVMELFEAAGGPKDIASVSEEGVSSTRMSGNERKEHVMSPDHVLNSWKARV